MISPAGLVVLLVVLALLWVVVRLFAQSGAQARGGGEAFLSERERTELDGLRTLVDDLKETAWDHREIDPALATIIIDKIRRHERRNRGELGP